MSCSILAAAVIAAASPAVAAAPPAPAVAVPPSIAAEPFYADIVNRSQRLKRIVDAWIAQGPGANPAAGADFATFRTDVATLAALDMKGHEDLKARNTDGDLKCILRGISEDMPGRVDAIAAAADARSRADALSEMAHLLEDNAAVLLAPPKPAA